LPYSVPKGSDMENEGNQKAARARILIVDDSAVVRALVGKCLLDAGYEVAEAGNGVTALRQRKILARSSGLPWTIRTRAGASRPASTPSRTGRSIEDPSAGALG